MTHILVGGLVLAKWEGKKSKSNLAGGKKSLNPVAPNLHLRLLCCCGQRMGLEKLMAQPETQECYIRTKDGLRDHEFVNPTALN